MTIGFNSVANLRVPFISVEFDATNAQQGPAIQPYKTLIVGMRTSAGTRAELLAPITVTSEAQASTLFGAGSMLYWMVKRYLENDKVTECQVVAINEVSGGVKATATLTLTGPATADGTLAIYIAGKKVSVGVLSGDTANTVAAAINTAVNADTDLQVTSGVSTNVVTLSAKHKGVYGNELDVRLNYNDDDATPAGIAVAVVAFASGATNPDIQDILDILPEDQFNVIVNPFTDSGNLTALATDLESKWGPSNANDGYAIMTKFAALATLQTLGNAHNSAHYSISGGAKSAPNSPWEWSSARAGQVSKSAQADPARPFQTLGLSGILPPRADEMFILSERNTLLFDGIASDKVVGGVVQIDRLISNYQFNAAAQADDAYLDATTHFTLSYLRYSFRNRMAVKFPRSKLASDGTLFGPGQPIVTPTIAKAEVISLFGDWESAGLVEGLSQFKRDLIVERNASNPNRLDFLLPPDLVNGLVNIAAQIKFLL